VDRLRDRVAGLDVHRDVVVGCVRVVADGERTVAKQRFKTTSAGLAGLASWLLDQRVELAVMEATGVYWKAPYYALEGVVPELWLVNARHVKNVPGRKTDLSDAEWLADVAAHGMVRPSLVPPPPIRELRELTRYRKTQVDARAKEIQRLEKVLQDAGIKLTSVTSTVRSKSSVAMVEAMIAGERNPDVLAGLARGRMRARIPDLSEALAGRFAAHHGVVARQILDHITFLDDSIAQLSAEVAARCAPFAKALDLLISIPGISRLTAEVFLAETGGDMSRFPSAGHLAAWAGVAPANAESAGKRHAAGTRQGARWLRRALVESAKAASHGKDTYLAAQYRRIARRRGPNKATVAVAHSIIVAAWHVLTNGEPYTDPGGDYFERRESSAARARRLVSQLEALGHRVTLTPAA
jgi:transposase